MSAVNFSTTKKGDVWNAQIIITILEDGLKFTSPVDGYETEIKGMKVEELKDFHNSKFFDEVLNMVSEMGGGRWICYDGGNTEYELIDKEHDGTYYFEVTERQ